MNPECNSHHYHESSLPGEMVINGVLCHRVAGIYTAYTVEELNKKIQAQKCKSQSILTHELLTLGYLPK